MGWTPVPQPLGVPEIPPPTLPPGAPNTIVETGANTATGANTDAGTNADAGTNTGAGTNTDAGTNTATGTPYTATNVPTGVPWGVFLTTVSGNPYTITYVASTIDAPTTLIRTGPSTTETISQTAGGV